MSRTTVKRHSVFRKRIMSLKDQQWDDIITTALELENHNQRKDNDGGAAVGDQAEESDDDEDDEDLFDPKYDDIPNDPIDTDSYVVV